MLDRFLVPITIVSCLVAVIRIILLLKKSKKRLREIAENESRGQITFYEEIDDLCLTDEVKKSIVVIFGLLVCPLSCVNVLFCSYAGRFSKWMSVVSIFVWHYLVIKEIENRQA